LSRTTATAALPKINRVLAAYADRGSIELSDPNIRAEQFFILVVGMPQRLALLGNPRMKTGGSKPQFACFWMDAGSVEAKDAWMR
jgi:hypothetical protein